MDMLYKIKGRVINEDLAPISTYSLLLFNKNRDYIDKQEIGDKFDLDFTSWKRSENLYIEMECGGSYELYFAGPLDNYLNKQGVFDIKTITIKNNTRKGE